MCDSTSFVSNEINSFLQTVKAEYDIVLFEFYEFYEFCNSLE